LSGEPVRFGEIGGRFFRAGDGVAPCVVLGHGYGTTMDSRLFDYAERFAAGGFHALCFDYRHFGESAGEPRQLLSPPRQIEDYLSALAYARSLDSVAADRVVVWGTSFAGGHVFEVAARDRRVAAAIAQTPAVDDLATVRMTLRRSGPRALARLTGLALRDALGARLGREPVMVPIVGEPGSVAVIDTPDAVPAMHAITGPTFRNEVCARALLHTYRPIKRASEMPCPVLVQIAAHDTLTPPGAAADAAWATNGRAEVRWYPIDHFDVYTGEPFERAVADQLHFLRRHLVRESDPALTAT
jgi:uncharacterized protein